MSNRNIAIFFLIAVVLLYSNTLKNPFHFDDFHSIIENPHIRAMKNIPAFFVDTQTFSVEQGGKMFRPLLLISYSINYAIHGYDVRGYRLFNILLHFFCVIGLMQLAYLLGADKRMSCSMGLLFLVNPLVAESINYVSSRSDLFVSFFVIWSIGFLLSKENRYALGIAFFVLGFLVKSMAIVMPPLLFLCDRSRKLWQNVYKKKFLIMSLCCVVLLYLSVIYQNSFLEDSLHKTPRGFVEQAFTHIKAQVYITWLCIMPVRLTVDHPFNPATTEITRAILCSILLIFSVTIFAIRARSHWLSIGWIWKIIALLPYAFIPLNLIVTERRIYLALIGVSVILAWVFTMCRDKKYFGSYGFYILIVIWVGITISRSAVWSSDIVLWNEAVNYNSNNPRALINLGLAYERNGNLTKAERYILEGLSLDPKIASGWLHLGNLQFNSGKHSEAERSYFRAISEQPNHAGSYYNLGNIFLGRGEIAKAEEFYVRAINLNPNLALAYNNLGQIYESYGKSIEALGAYQKSNDADPELPQPYYNRAVLLEKMGDHNSALNDYSQAYKLMESLKDSDEINLSRRFQLKALQGINRLRDSIDEEK